MGCAMLGELRGQDGEAMTSSAAMTAPFAAAVKSRRVACRCEVAAGSRVKDSALPLKGADSGAPGSGETLGQKRGRGDGVGFERGEEALRRGGPG